MTVIRKLFHRLDIQLSVLVGGIVALWFISFMISASLLNQERIEKNTFLERERIKIKVDSELMGLLNDLLLDHRKSLELALQDIHHSLGLSFIELRTKGKGVLRYGNGKTDGSHYVLEQSFPLRFDGREYGVLSLGKELWIMNGSEAVPKKWMIGIAAVMLLIFYMIRLFVQKQIVRPLNFLINAFGEAKFDKELSYRTHSSEMDEVVAGFKNMRQRILDYQTKNIEIERQAALGELAAQVAHDIRSPLTALSVVNEDLSELPESKRVLVRSAVTRIRDIANNLLEKKNISKKELSDDEKLSTLPISGMVESLLSEKRLQFRSKIGLRIYSEVDASAFGVFAHIQPAAFKSLLSNVINNAVEAISGPGEVRVSLAAQNGAITIQISDNGSGIPFEIQGQLFKKGATFGKRDGSGLGLYHAREKISQWGGRISIESAPGKGTSVTLFLPQVAKPQWFVNELKIPQQGTIGILDDDPSVHHTWEERLAGAGKLVHFFNPEELAAWKRGSGNTASLFLIDYEMNAHSLNGLDVIESLGLERKCILVTSHSEDETIVSRCNALNVPLLPKEMADSVPIAFI